MSHVEFMDRYGFITCRTVDLVEIMVSHGPLSPALRDRVDSLRGQGGWAVWDCELSPDCWILVGNDPEELARETSEAFNVGQEQCG